MFKCENWGQSWTMVEESVNIQYVMMWGFRGREWWDGVMSQHYYNCPLMLLLGHGKSQRVAWVWPTIQSMVCSPTFAQWTAHRWQLCICSGGWQTLCGRGAAGQWQCMQLCFILWHATQLLEICSPSEHSEGQVHGRSRTTLRPFDLMSTCLRTLICPITPCHTTFQLSHIL